MRTRILVATLILIMGCGGTTSPVAPSPSPEYALQEFMAAVADSNLPKMAEYWGTARGSAAETGQPSDYARRIQVIQVYLRGYSYRVLASVPADASLNSQSMEIQMTRDGCEKQVPFLAVKTSNKRWVIQSLDLTAVGSPVEPCSQ